MFNSLCGLDDASVGESMTGIFHEHPMQMIKMVVYPHWVHIIKASMRFQWRVRGHVKAMKTRFVNLEKLLFSEVDFSGGSEGT